MSAPHQSFTNKVVSLVIMPADSRRSTKDTGQPLPRAAAFLLAENRICKMKNKNKNKNKRMEKDFAWSSRGVLSKRNDARIARIRQLQHKQPRDQQQLFLCEGARFLIQAMEHGVHIQMCVYCPQLFPTTYSPKLVARFERRGVPTMRVTAEVFQMLSLADEPSGLLAVCRQKTRSLIRTDDRRGGASPRPVPEHVPAGVRPLYLALSSVRSPGNLGTIMRTCAAVGVTALILLSDETDPYHPAAVRASMGAIMGLNIVRATPDEFFAWAQTHGVQVVGTSAAAQMDYRGVDYSMPTAVLMGSERKGMHAQLEQRCHRVVSIPMPGAVDSLNLAVATGVVLYEAVRKRELQPD
jgi:TrmH family RNA methyltransferase